MLIWRKWKTDFLHLCGNKLYMFMLCLTALGSYGFLITHQTVGIDDTPYAYYFEEGLNAIVGRWFLFLINKVFRISDFSPFITDLAGVLILMAGVTVWCTLLYSVCRDRVPLWGYAFFSCIFLSCPLISEVYTYYLHNGISVGYLCTGISLCFFRELAGEREKGRRREMFAAGLGMAVFLFIALGCYESFMVVWLLGVFLVLLTLKYMGQKGGVFYGLALGALGAVAALVVRAAAIAGIIGLFGLGDMRDQAVLRSVGEMLGWIFKPDGLAEFAMAVKRFYVMYVVFAHAYYPIKIFVVAAVFMAAFGIYGAIRRRNGWLALLTFGCFAACFALVFVEGKVTLYRSAQFLPVICGYGAFLAAYGVQRQKAGETAREGRGRKNGAGEAVRDENGRKNETGKRLSVLAMPGGWIGRTAKGLLIFVLCVILWNQCFDMNRWFYVDWMKYQSAVDMAEQIGNQLKRGFDTSKPVVFTGTYRAPRGIIEGAYVNYGTVTFYKMKRMTDPLDEHLLEKFYRDEYGVWVAQTPALSVLDWGVSAFGGDEELVRFFAMHGYEIVGNKDQERFEAATQHSVGLPHFPADGSIVDMGDYIIVHF